ncbi:type I-E CRISPR-associated protein Cas5/CasD [Streptomyces cathayae]|uniref:Type I-E CRISPR-associated protein Cas5/CasD n=1 Tax=Streptomyces cathayae TaxID=3031124 RepID=A0ABY8JYR3_9ACTN|nr:type I-E CRISPR-associated protein Cas5/CasD [Streptomyces sp. HUAS 5]WGD39816.1 type I-E CRISPR-associated protein Cas5/CasD [Streptomyces sp. HUAS 5]
MLRLAGPLQSWGERSAFTAVRDTASFPTRSALIGLFAAAEGIGRDDGRLGRYDSLRITVRIDRQGTRAVDYHTVGGGLPKARTAATSGGSNKGAAVITRRHYLSDAVFVVAVSGPEQILTGLAAALRRPHWAPYLGRRSCVPDEPFVLRGYVEDPEEELRTRVPLSLSTPADLENDTVAVDFLREDPPSGASASWSDTLDINDAPVSFSQHGRAHRMRRLYRTTEYLPWALTGPQHTLLRRLIHYARTEESA